MRRSPVMNMMIRAAEKAGRAVVRDFGEVEHLQASMKGPRDFASIARQKAERALREDLQRARPRFGMLMEGSEPVEGADTSHRFIVDPICGSVNFMHGIPYFAVSVAMEESREVAAGVVYNPITDELFWAERNGGAYLHDRRLRVAKRKAPGDALVAAPPYAAGGDQEFDDWSALTARLARLATVRIYGSAALNLVHVAAGRLDGYADLGLRPWDIAAGAIILQEAGGDVTDFAGGKGWLAAGEVVAASTDFHGPLLKAANGA